MAFSRSDKRGRLHQPQDDVNLLQRMLGNADHIFPKLILCFVDTGSVQKDNLPPLIRIYGLNPVSCSLRFVGRNRDFLSNQMVHKRGFSHIRPPY